jgi:hypothetical protein
MRDTDDKQPDTDPDVEDPGTGGPDAETDGPESDGDRNDGDEAPDGAADSESDRFQRQSGHGGLSVTAAVAAQAFPRHRRSAGHLPRGARLRPLTGTRIVRRVVAAGVASLGLLIPTTTAAFSAKTMSNNDTWTVPNYSYPTEINNLGPYIYWRLDDAAASATAIDSSVNGRNGAYNSTWTKQITGALVDEPTNLAVTATNAAATGANVSCVYAPPTANYPVGSSPKTYSLITWFKTATLKGGKLIGQESAQAGVAPDYDRMLYMDGNGRIWFGVYITATNMPLAISSAAGLNDGNWHMAAATMSTTTGMALYIDGVLVATNANTVSETETRVTYWRAGCGNLSGWDTAHAVWTGANSPVASTNYPFNGSIDEATVYSGSALTAQQVTFLYWIR